MVDRSLEWVSRTLLVLAALLAFAMCFVVVADVIGRVLFNSPVKGTPEIVSYSIVMICYLQAAYAIRSGGMINVDAVYTFFPYRVQSLFAAIGCLLGIMIFGLIGWGGIDGALHAWRSGEYEGEGALRIPAWPARFVIVLGAGLAALTYFLLLLRQLNAFRRGLPPVDTSSSH